MTHVDCGSASRGADIRSPLSPREREVLTWVARGKSGRDVAEILQISPHTVDTLMRRILTKTDSVTRTQAAVRAAQRGWLPTI